MKLDLEISIVTMLIALPLNASVSVGIEHSLPVEKLFSIVATLNRATSRSDAMQQQVVYYEISTTVLLRCLPHKPDKSGNGCELIVNPASEAKKGEARLTIIKPLEKILVTQKATEIKEKIGGLDPNWTEEHIHVGNPLYFIPSPAKDGTHCYCAPEGTAGKKSWQCYLSVSENLSERP